MTTGSTNITVITEENNDGGVKDLALVSSVADNPEGTIVDFDVPLVTVFHNTLLGLQGGDLQNRYHLNKVLYDALKINSNASQINRFLILPDLNAYYTKTQIDALLISKASVTSLTAETNARIANDNAEIIARSNGDNVLDNKIITGLTLKVDKLGYIPFTADDKAKLDALGSGTGTPDLSAYVLKVPGKGLSTNDFTNEYKTKLDSLTTGGGLSLLLTDIIDATVGQNNIVIPQLVGKDLLYVIVNGVRTYRSSTIANNKTVNYNKDFGYLVFNSNFAAGDFVWAAYNNDPNWVPPTPNPGDSFPYTFPSTF